jgi:hypothetical protein
MRRNLPWLLPMLGLLCLACGGSGGTAGTGSGGQASTSTGTTDATTGTGTSTTTATTSTGTGTGGMMMAGNVPDPGSGNQVDQDFTDKEPNDTPATATPLGVAMTGSVNVWVTSNTIGGSDSADYFVFKSGAMAGTFTFNICFSAPVTEMTATLWKVVNSTAQMPPVGTWMSSGTCVQSPPMGSIPLEASTNYLFGLTATGGSASYNA